ncbi:hypothetical protein [Faecalibacter sp. LW9]|uniref:hypothetical protein n=1 Tax=Faecalibacter sp. LW9 TaxID=3103144 RepID=UPI002AFE77F7|nr:hypothetical protein [Faecalibacter sp. LW9]
MKKFFAVVAVATLSLGAVACGEKTETQVEEQLTDSTAVETAVVDSVAVDSTAVETPAVDSTAVETPATEEAPAQ